MALDHRKIFKTFRALSIFISVLAFVFAFGTFFWLYGVVEQKKYNYFILTCLTCNGGTTMCLTTFILILYCFYVRFDLINSCIKQNFVTQEEDIGRSPKESVKILSKLILKLADLHDNLVDNTNLTNYCFAFQMMNVSILIKVPIE